MISFTGRKGQVCGLDIFDKGANNHNIFVTATTGSGKSFMVNYMVSKYYAANAMVRIIDIGGSYKKMNKIYGAKYIDFSQGSKICINPFSNILTDNKEDFAGSITSVAAVVKQMAYCATDKIPEQTAEVEMKLLMDAVQWAYYEVQRLGETGDPGAYNGIDLVQKYLIEFPADASAAFKDASHAHTQNLIMIAKNLAFNIKDFTSQGMYGKWFNGVSNFDIAQDEFVVLELEHLKPLKEFFKVVTLLVIDAVTRDLYLSDRSRPRFIIFDEAWQFIKENREGGAVSATPLSEVIEEGYRRARKYQGSFSIITQSLLDLKAFGKVGDVIRGNSDFKFFLESVDFDKALNEKLIDYDEFTMRMLKSLKSNKPKYSEIFMDTPFGVGVARLIVDPYSYFVYTSDPTEIAEIERYVESGITYEEAIVEMINKHRPDYFKKNYEKGNINAALAKNAA